MGCGLPVVVTDVGGVRDYVREDSVSLITKGDSKVAAEAVIDLLDDEDKRRRWAEANRQQALRFDWPVVAEEMKQVYRQVWEY
jgi:glycosyltransferase involved in cell wall biosynthesis